MKNLTIIVKILYLLFILLFLLLLRFLLLFSLLIIIMEWESQLVGGVLKFTSILYFLRFLLFLLLILIYFWSCIVFLFFCQTGLLLGSGWVYKFVLGPTQITPLLLFSEIASNPTFWDVLIFSTDRHTDRQTDRPTDKGRLRSSEPGA